MKHKFIIPISCILVLAFLSFLSMNLIKKEEKLEKTTKITAKVLNQTDEEVTLLDTKDAIYTFKVQDIQLQNGEDVIVEYTGKLNKAKELQDNEVVSVKSIKTMQVIDDIPMDYNDDGIFSQYYSLAYKKLSKMTLDEKIGQLFLVRYPDSNAVSDLEKYQFAGYVFFSKDFRDKDEQSVKNMIKEVQDVAKIPLLTAVDEEGGTVVRVSSNPKLAPERFKSSSELYNEGGLDKIKEDTELKSKVLKNLGLNLNLAPVVDVATSSSDYMYDRSLKQNTQITSDYAKTVIKAGKNSGVSYTLKHFPGYASNADTHSGSSVDSRSYEEILEKDIPPFKAGIEEGAEAVLVSHNIVDAIDSVYPASLSTNVHNLLRNELSFTGVIITDDLEMAAVSSIGDVTLRAVNAGNNLIITTDYEDGFNSIKNAIENKTISESQIDRLVFKTIAWKYYKGLLFDNQK